MRRCPHDRAAPRLTLAIPVAKNLPRVLLDGIKRARRIYTHPRSFPELTGEDIAPGMRIRARRPERLRTVSLLAQAMIRRVDRRTMRVGDQRNDGLCTGISVEELAQHTGLCERCISRALAEGEGKYWVSVQPVVEIKDASGNPAPIRRVDGTLQTHVGLPSVRVLTDLLWRRLGVTKQKLTRARAHGAEAWKARRAPPASLVGMRAIRRTMREELAAETERARRERFESLAAARLERLRPKPKP